MGTTRAERNTKVETHTRPGWTVAWMLATAISVSMLPWKVHADAIEPRMVATAMAPGAPMRLLVEGVGVVEDTFEPVVFLNGHATPLKVTRVGAGSIAVELPPDLAWGSYVLRIRRSHKAAQFEERAFDVGIVGPTVQDD